MADMAELEKYIRSVPDFPRAGINFKDITTLLKDAKGFRMALDAMQAEVDGPIDLVVGVESRGFIFGCPLADRLAAGFVPVRKPEKLPAETMHREYELEYGTDRVEIHRDAITPGQRILLVDDLLATGGTMAAAAHLVEALGGTIVKILFLIELTFLNGREKLEGYPIKSDDRIRPSVARSIFVFPTQALICHSPFLPTPQISAAADI